MIAVNLDHVSVTYLNDPIFEEISWEIQENRCVGLVGPNGSGKSTLLKLIAGEISSGTGFVSRRKGLTIGYLPQEPRLEAGRSVLQETLTASSDLRRVEEELGSVEDRLGDPAVYGNEKLLTRLLDSQAKLLEEYSRLGGASYPNRVRSLLISLGFNQAELDLPVDVLSGGQKKLVGLAKLLVTQPDLLLLDEADNHLDLEGKEFLERLIQEYKGTVVLVSHDRYLLDLVTDEIVELENGRLDFFPGTYSEFAYEKEVRRMRQLQLFETQQKEISRLEQAAKRLMTWGKVYDNEKFSKRGQNILKRVEKIERVDQPNPERRRMGLDLAGWRGSTKVLEISQLDKTFHDPAGAFETNLFTGIDLLIRHGERVGLVGPNGAGKSVLFRIILGEETATSGDIRIGPSIQIGYYAQAHETLDLKRTLIDTVRDAAECSESDAVAILGRFLFTYQQCREQISSLSGGERSRLQLLLLTLKGPNFLLLDEPTNNLDIASAEVLENALYGFKGSLLVISHDRYFLDRVVQRTAELDSGSLKEYLGNYSDYQEAKDSQRKLLNK